MEERGRKRAEEGEADVERGRERKRGKVRGKERDSGRVQIESEKIILY